MGNSMRQFYDHRNESTRIDVLDELNDYALAAVRVFARQIGAPHLVDEVIRPIINEGDSQLVAAVQDRPWPPWGLGARTISALCQTQAVADDSYAVSPVYVTDQDLTNVGLVSAVYKEALEQLATSPRAEICYLVAEGSMLADKVMSRHGFTRSEDVFVTWTGRYYTYRAPIEKVLASLGLEHLDTPDLLAHDLPGDLLEANALFHQTIYLGSRAEWIGSDTIASEINRLIRGGHASKPGGVPSGTGRFAFDPADLVRDPFFVWISNLLGGGVTDPQPVAALVDHVVRNEKRFMPASIVQPDSSGVVVDERMRRAVTLDDLGEFEGVLTERIKEQLQEVVQRLGMKEFVPGRIEMQITASNDGDYFRLHKDSDATDTRELTFVLFFHREPRRYSGGELRIYPTRMVDGRLQPADHAVTLSPRQDAIVFFPSLNDHEVLPVRVASGEFADGRFTVNGWIHRQ